MMFLLAQIVNFKSYWESHWLAQWNKFTRKSYECDMCDHIITRRIDNAWNIDLCLCCYINVRRQNMLGKIVGNEIIRWPSQPSCEYKCVFCHENPAKWCTNNFKSICDDCAKK